MSYEEKLYLVIFDLKHAIEDDFKIETSNFDIEVLEILEQISTFSDYYSYAIEFKMFDFFQSIKIKNYDNDKDIKNFMNSKYEFLWDLYATDELKKSMLGFGDRQNLIKMLKFGLLRLNLETEINNIKDIINKHENNLFYGYEYFVEYHLFLSKMLKLIIEIINNQEIGSSNLNLETKHDENFFENIENSENNVENDCSLDSSIKADEFINKKISESYLKTKKTAINKSTSPIIYYFITTIVLLIFIVFYIYNFTSIPANWLYKSAEKKIQSKNFTGAIKDYTKAISFQPDSIEIFYTKRGLTYYHIKNYDAAINDFSTAIIKNNKYAEAYLYRGKINIELGKKLSFGINDLNDAVKLSPNNAKLYHEVGKIKFRNYEYFDIDELDNGIYEFKIAISLNPFFTEAYFYLGLVHDEDEEFNYINYCINRHPKSAALYLIRAKKQSDLALAIKDYTKAIDLLYLNEKKYNKVVDGYINIFDHNVNAVPYFDRGRKKFFNSDFQGCIDDYTKSIEKNEKPQFCRKNIGYTYYFRGLSFERLGQIENCCDDMKKAMNLDCPYALEDYKFNCN